MKKYYLFFIMLLCVSINLSVRSAEASSKEEITFSIKNSDKSGESLFFIAVNGGRLLVGLVKPEEWLDGIFDITEITRLYLWGENLESWTSRELRERLKEVVLDSHDTKIDQIAFPLKPNWVFEFPQNKTMHFKWKNRKLQPRDGSSRFTPRKRRGKYTQEGYGLRNNVTANEIRGSVWRFDAERGQWLDYVTETREKFDEVGL